MDHSAIVFFLIGGGICEAVIGAFFLIWACRFHNYVCDSIVEEYETTRLASPGNYPPADKWDYAPKPVEVPEVGRAMLIKGIAAVVGTLCAVAVTTIEGPSLFLAVPDIFTSYLAISLLFCLVMSEPAEKGILIALLDRLITLFVAVVVVGGIVIVPK